ncbi:MAG: hypothetical protein IJY93_03840 [Clostridia bacterium]|nr:hypothetical protein [Clostridia bacterium]
MKKGIIVNQESEGLQHPIGLNPTWTVDDIRAVPHEFEGTHITDYFLCVNNTCSSYPSKTRTSYLDKYHQTVENGKPVDHKGLPRVVGAHYIYEVLGVDEFTIQIEEYKKIGINPWITFRMNDFHDHGMETSPNLTDFYHEHPEVRRVKFHPEFIHTAADFARDWGHEIVREDMKAFINETLERYDPYGIELDFQRELDLFAIGREYEGIEILNGFIREIDALVHKYEEKYGHEIKIGVRVAPDIQTNLDFGLDVMQWVQEGIVDLVTIAARFESNDTDMPVKLWSTLLKPYGTMLAVCIEPGFAPYKGHDHILPSIDTFAACAANAYSQGADRVYFFNMFHTNIKDPFDKSAPFITDGNVWHEAGPALYWTLINKLGDYDEVLKMNRRHVITYKDRSQLWRRNTCKPTENRGLWQLPLTFDRDGCFKMHVGDIPEGAKVTVRFAVSEPEKAMANPPRVFVNSEKCEYLGCEDDKRWYEKPLFAYSVPKEAFGPTLCPYLIVNEDTTVEYMEAYIKVTK